MDRSLLTGESAPETVQPGSLVHAGELNLTGPVTIEITAAGNDTFLSELVRLMAAAEQGQSRYIRIADRLARFYSPAVHTLAATTLVSWLVLGHGWHDALMAAVAVLIITCPCALGLAVPAVQVVASGRLFRSGMMIKDGAALEKLSGVDTVIFDKTGTLTRGEPELVSPLAVSTETLALAAGLAQASKHPLSRALVREVARRGLTPVDVIDVTEHPGLGLAGTYARRTTAPRQPRLVRRRGSGRGQGPARIRLPPRRQAAGDVPFRRPDLRSDAAETVAALKTHGARRASAVRRPRGRRQPRGRCRGHRNRRVARLAASQARLCRGAVEGRQESADGRRRHQRCPGTRRRLHLDGAVDRLRHWPHRGGNRVHGRIGSMPSPKPFEVSRRTQTIAKQNFVLAVGYNVLAVPLAMAGLVSPLVAAIAMSTSSIIVIANALRVGLGKSAATRCRTARCQRRSQRRTR